MKKLREEKEEINKLYVAGTSDSNALELYNEHVKNNPSKYVGPGTTLVLSEELNEAKVRSYYNAFSAQADLEAGNKRRISNSLNKPSDDAAAAYAASMTKKVEAEADLKLAIASLKHFEGTDLKSLKKEFMEVYGDGTKDGAELGQWTSAQIKLMEGLLELIEREEKSGELDETYAGYSDDLKNNIKRNLVADSATIEPLLANFDKSKTFQEVVESMGIRKNDPELIKENLTIYKNALEGIKKYRKLSPTEEFFRAQAEYYINNGKYDDRKPEVPTPNSELKLPELVSALKGTGALAESAIITLDAWKGTANFKDETKIKKLVEDYKPGASDATKVGNFQEHLNHEWGSSKEKITGNDYWEKFVKQTPKFIIGAIKHYEWEKGLKDYKDKPKDEELKTEMKAANDFKEDEGDDKEVKAEKVWDTEKSADIAHFLYKKAENMAGKDLCKSYTTVDKKKKRWWRWQKNNHWWKILI